MAKSAGRLPRLGSKPVYSTFALLALAALSALIPPSASKLIITGYNTSFTATTCKTSLSSAWPYSTPASNLVGSSDVSISQGLDDDNVSGAIVLVPSWKAITLSETALKYQRRGALALVISTSYEQGGRTIWTTRFQYRTDENLQKEITIPIFQVVDSECRNAITALTRNKDPSIFFTASLNNEENYNAFAELADSPLGTALHFLFGLPPLFGLALVIWRVIPIIRYESSRTESFVTLALIGLGHGFRILFAVDPHGMRSLLTPYVILFFSSTHIAVGLICDLVILFHWNTALNSFGAKNLNWLRKYVFIFLAFVVALEITFSALRMFEIAPAVILAFQLFYVVVELAVIIFIIYTAVGLFRYLNGAAIDKKSKRARGLVLKMTRLLIASSVFILVLIVATVAVALPPFRSARSEMILWLVGLTAMTTIGILETLVVREGRDKEKERLSRSRSRVPSSLKLRSQSTLSLGTVSSMATSSLPSQTDLRSVSVEPDPSKKDTDVAAAQKGKVTESSTSKIESSESIKGEGSTVEVSTSSSSDSSEVASESDQ